MEDICSTAIQLLCNATIQLCSARHKTFALNIWCWYHHFCHTWTYFSEYQELEDRLPVVFVGIQEASLGLHLESVDGSRGKQKCFSVFSRVQWVILITKISATKHPRCSRTVSFCIGHKSNLQSFPFPPVQLHYPSPYTYHPTSTFGPWLLPTMAALWGKCVSFCIWTT